MSHNLFYGFSILNAKVQEQLQSVVSDFREVVPRAIWTGPDKWHVTLHFLGKNTTIDHASDKLMCLEFPSFTAEIKGAGYFVNNKGPRVLWADISKKEQFRSLYQALGGTGLYSPHLTIAKLEGKGDSDIKLAEIAKGLADHVFGTILVQNVALYQTQGGGLPYKVLAEKRLTT